MIPAFDEWPDAALQMPFPISPCSPQMNHAMVPDYRGVFP
jgi:hypothetical protein